VLPDQPGFGRVAGFGGVDADEAAQTFAVFRVLPDGDVDAVLIEDRRGDDLARPVVGGVFERLAVLHAVLRRVAVELPDLLENVGVPVAFGRLRAEAVAPAVAAAEDDEVFVADLAERGRRPVRVQRARRDAGAFLADEFPGLL